MMSPHFVRSGCMNAVMLVMCWLGAFDRDLLCRFRLDRLCLKKMSVNTLSRLAFDVFNDDGVKIT